MLDCFKGLWSHLHINTVPEWRVGITLKWIRDFILGIELWDLNTVRALLEQGSPISFPRGTKKVNYAKLRAKMSVFSLHRANKSLSIYVQIMLLLALSLLLVLVLYMQSLSHEIHKQNKSKANHLVIFFYTPTLKIKKNKKTIKIK